MTATTTNRSRQHSLPGFEVRNPNVTQGADSREIRLQELHRLLAIGPAAVVFSRGQFVFNHAVAYDQTDILRT
jgi:hypothetical protein